MMVYAMPSHRPVLCSQAVRALVIAAGNPHPLQTIGVHDQQPDLKVKGFLLCRAGPREAGR